MIVTIIRSTSHLWVHPDCSRKGKLRDSLLLIWENQYLHRGTAGSSLLTSSLPQSPHVRPTDYLYNSTVLWKAQVTNTYSWCHLLPSKKMLVAITQKAPVWLYYSHDHRERSSTLSEMASGQSPGSSRKARRQNKMSEYTAEMISFVISHIKPPASSKLP